MKISINSILALSLLVTASQVFAMPREGQLGAGSVSSSMAGTGVASINSGAATYLNPANLAYCKKSGVDLGIKYLSTQFSATYTSGANKGQDQVGDIAVAEIGACFVPIERLGIGVWTSTTGSRPITMDLITLNDTLSFFRFNHALQAPTIMAGVGYAFVPEISLGLAISVTMDTYISQTVVAPLTESSTPFYAKIGAKIKPHAGVVAGLTVKPFDVFSFGATFRSSNFSLLDIDASTSGAAFDVAIPIIVNLKQGVLDYSPRQYSIGFSYKPLTELNLLADLTYATWSDFSGPFLDVTVDKNSAISSGIPLPDDENFTFKDIFVPKFGVEYSFGQAIAARAGYAYHPGVVGAPTQLANLVDAATHTLSAGGGYRVESESFGFRADIFVATHIMPRTSVSKNFKGLPLAYSFGGLAIATGLSAGIEF